MIKWFLILGLTPWLIWLYFSYTSAYTPISKQIDLKTMSVKKPDFIITTRNKCVGNCTNYSSSSSYWWGGSFWWK